MCMYVFFVSIKQPVVSDSTALHELCVLIIGLGSIYIALRVCVCACLRDFVMKVRSVEGVTAEAGYLKHF